MAGSPVGKTSSMDFFWPWSMNNVLKGGRKVISEGKYASGWSLPWKFLSSHVC